MGKQISSCGRSVLLIFLGTFAPSVAASADFSLKDGDHVVFYGDSPSDQPYYDAFVELYAVTRFPRLNAAFTSSGVRGDKVTGGDEGGSIDLRLRRDVIDYKPTVVVVMLGLADAGFSPWNEASFKSFATGYEHIVNTLKKSLPGARIVLIQHSPYDEVTLPPLFEGGCNAVLIRYNQFVRELGERERATVVDFNGPVVELLRRAKEADAGLARELIPDRVNPGRGASLIMAAALLKAWNAPAVVASVEIDAGAGRVTRADNATVADLSVRSSTTWTETDGALPLELSSSDKPLMFAFRKTGFLEALGREPLKVVNLPAARYALTIDGMKAGDFTKQQLRAGINLADVPTPMREQSLKVYSLTMKRKDIHYRSWNAIRLPFDEYQSAHERAAVKALDSLEEELVARRRAEAQPIPRHYALVPE